jgi:hypothetical protein
MFDDIATSLQTCRGCHNCGVLKNVYIFNEVIYIMHKPDFGVSRIPALVLECHSRMKVLSLYSRVLGYTNISSVLASSRSWSDESGRK